MKWMRGAAVALAVGLSAGAACAAEVRGPKPEILRVPPGRYAVVAGIGSETVMAAYQKSYAMNFEIWRPIGLPAGWYATFDGFPVAQVAENRWVYGQLGVDGALIPTDILVGSVLPMDVPALARVAAEWGYNIYLNNPEFRKILKYRCTHMGLLNDPLMRTVIAWDRNKPGVWIWLGTRWKRIDTQSGEYTWQALLRHRFWIAERLREGEFWAFSTVDLGDLARQWGLIWMGRLALREFDAYQEGGEGRTASVQSAVDSGANTHHDSPGNWDVD